MSRQIILIILCNHQTRNSFKLTTEVQNLPTEICLIQTTTATNTHNHDTNLRYLLVFCSLKISKTSFDSIPRLDIEPLQIRCQFSTSADPPKMMAFFKGKELKAKNCETNPWHRSMRLCMKPMGIRFHSI